MDTPAYRSTRVSGLADAVVSGLIAGLWAGLAMLAYLMVASWTLDDAPVILMTIFAPYNQPSLLTGAMLHLAVSGVYGMAYGLLWYWTPQPVHHMPRWLGGVLYGMLLLGLAEAVILPGPGAALTAIPLLHFALAHLVYGLVLAVRMGRLAG